MEYAACQESGLAYRARGVCTQRRVVASGTYPKFCRVQQHLAGRGHGEGYRLSRARTRVELAFLFSSSSTPTSRRFRSTPFPLTLTRAAVRSVLQTRTSCSSPQRASSRRGVTPRSSISMSKGLQPTDARSPTSRASAKVVQNRKVFPSLAFALSKQAFRRAVFVVGAERRRALRRARLWALRCRRVWV